MLAEVAGCEVAKLNWRKWKEDHVIGDDPSTDDALPSVPVRVGDWNLLSDQRRFVNEAEIVAVPLYIQRNEADTIEFSNRPVYGDVWIPREVRGLQGRILK